MGTSPLFLVFKRGSFEHFEGRGSTLPEARGAGIPNLSLFGVTVIVD
jgi:hypothetical protein